MPACIASMISVSVRDRGRGELRCCWVRASKSPLRYLSVARRTSREAARAIVVDMLPRRRRHRRRHRGSSSPADFPTRWGWGAAAAPPPLHGAALGVPRPPPQARRYEGHDQEVYAKLIFKSAATILREIGFAFFPPLDRDTSNSNSL